MAGGRRRHVHHGTPDLHDPPRLATLCAAYARVHKLASLPEAFVKLWAEQRHPVPLQLPFEGRDVG